MTARVEKRHAQTARREYLLAHLRCEVGASVCGGYSTQVHHRLRRAQGGSDEPSNLCATCLPCHDLIHREPALAYRNGWLVHSWDLVP